MICEILKIFKNSFLKHQANFAEFTAANAAGRTRKLVFRFNRKHFNAIADSPSWTMIDGRAATGGHRTLYLQLRTGTDTVAVAVVAGLQQSAGDWFPMRFSPWCSSSSCSTIDELLCICIHCAPTHVSLSLFLCVCVLTKVLLLLRCYLPHCPLKICWPHRQHGRLLDSCLDFEAGSVAKHPLYTLQMCKLLNGDTRLVNKNTCLLRL